MGEVTIDSIQIEIESNSTNASKGLDALAETLGQPIFCLHSFTFIYKNGRALGSAVIVICVDFCSLDQCDIS